MKKVLFILIAYAVALAVIAAGAATWRFYVLEQPPEPPPPKLTLTLGGEKDVYLEYGQTYSEAGAYALFTKDGVVTGVPVEMLGQVDNRKVGEYVITYTARAEGLEQTATRRIHITDTENPVITLVADPPDSYTLVGNTYEEAGFTAYDNYDGDITQKVIRTEADGVITYTVSDSSGNTHTVTRTVNYFDPGRPNLYMMGALTTLIITGDEYIDPGVVAIDQNDGDISIHVQVDGKVDTTTAGLYTLRYTATNSYGFATSVERKVYVLPADLVPVKEKDPDAPEMPTQPENPDQPQEPVYPDNCVIPQGGMAYAPNGKVIYLTFDDGPTQHTGRLLDILGRYQVKASFFVINSSRIDMIARTAKEGHTVAIHAYNHDYAKIYASDEAFLADLQAMQEVIVKHTGKETMLTRFPGGSSNSISRNYNIGIMSRLTQTLTEMGYTYFDWNVDSDDAGRARTPEKVFENIINEVKWYKNSVVLQHDSHDYSVDAVERLIVWGLVNGYIFQPLTADSPTCHHPILN